MARTGFTDSAPASAARRTLLIASLSLLTGMLLHATVLGRPAATEVRREQRNVAPAVGDATTLPADGEPAAPRPAGPARVEHGVPAGFAGTPNGATAAAAAYVCTGQALLDMDPLAAEKAVRQMAAAATADRQVADTMATLREVRTTLASGTGPIVYRQAAVAWRVESFSPHRARVAVWNVGVLARDGVAPPQAGWAISTFDLLWERGDWKVFDERITPGPAPILDDSAAPATAAQLIVSLRRFNDFRSGV